MKTDAVLIVVIAFTEIAKSGK